MLYLIGYDKRRKKNNSFYLLIGSNDLKQIKDIKQILENIRKNKKETFIKYKIISQKKYYKLYDENLECFKQ